MLASDDASHQQHNTRTKAVTEGDTSASFVRIRPYGKEPWKKAALRLMSAAGSQTDKTFLKASVVVTFFVITRRLRSLSSWG